MQLQLNLWCHRSRQKTPQKSGNPSADFPLTPLAKGRWYQQVRSLAALTGRLTTSAHGPIRTKHGRSICKSKKNCKREFLLGGVEPSRFSFQSVSNESAASRCGIDFDESPRSCQYGFTGLFVPEFLRSFHSGVHLPEVDSIWLLVSGRPCFWIICTASRLHSAAKLRRLFDIQSFSSQVVIRSFPGAQTFVGKSTMWGGNALQPVIVKDKVDLIFT